MDNDTAQKKKLKKKKKIEPVIPKTLTANIGELRRNEMKEEPPEEFVNATPKKTPPSLSKINDSSLSESSNSETIKTLGVQSIPSGLKESVNQKNARPTKVVHNSKEDKVIEYNIDIGRTYSQSSGTLSYDSFLVPDTAKLNTYKALGSTQKHLNQNIQQSKKIEVVGKFEDVIVLEPITFANLTTGDKCPPEAEPTPEFLCGQREIQLAKDSINAALDEFFNTDRDDLDLIVRAQRRGPFPIISLTITTNPRCNIATNIGSNTGSSVASSTIPSVGAIIFLMLFELAFYFFLLFFEFASFKTQLNKAHLCHHPILCTIFTKPFQSTIVASSYDVSTARSFSNLVSSTFNLLMGVIRPCIESG